MLENIVNIIYIIVLFIGIYFVFRPVIFPTGRKKKQKNKIKTFWLVSDWNDDKRIFKSKEKAIEFFHVSLFLIGQPVEYKEKKNSSVARYYDIKIENFRYLTIEEIPLKK